MTSGSHSPHTRVQSSVMNPEDMIRNTDENKRILEDELGQYMNKLLGLAEERESIPGRLSHGWIAGKLGELSINSSYVYITRQETDEVFEPEYRLLLKETVASEKSSIKLTKRPSESFIRSDDMEPATTEELQDALRLMSTALKKRIIPSDEHA